MALAHNLESCSHHKSKRHFRPTDPLRQSFRISAKNISAIMSSNLTLVSLSRQAIASAAALADHALSVSVIALGSFMAAVAAW